MTYEHPTWLSDGAMAGAPVNMVAAVAIDRYGALHDAWELSRLVDLVWHCIRPAVVLEIGSHSGGSLYAWHALGAEVVALSLPLPVVPEFEPHGADMVWLNSHAPEAEQAIRTALAGRVPEFAFIDGDHTEHGCRADLDLVRRLAPRAVVALHDVNLHHRVPACGVRTVFDQARKGVPHLLIENDPATDPGVGVLWPARTE